MNKEFSNPINIIFILPAFRSLMFILAGYIPLWLSKDNTASLTETAKWWPLSFIVVNMITLVLILTLLKREGKTFASLIKSKKGDKIKLTEALWVIPVMIVLGMGGLVGFSLIFSGHLPTATLQPLPLWTANIALVLLPLSVVFTEIPFYMGYCASRLEQRSKLLVFSLVYPLFFFALQHSFIPLLWDVRHIVTRFFVFVPLLIFMGLRYRKTHDLRVMMIGHGILDLFTAIQLFVVSIDPSIYELMISNS